MKVRPLRWWDLAQVSALEPALFPDDPWSLETWWGELAQSRARRYLVAVEDDGGPDATIVGYAGLLVTGRDAEVMTVAVRADRQGQGVGQALTEQLMAAGRLLGADRLLLEVRADNEAAQRLYARSGFEQIAVRRGYYRTAGAAVDAWVMGRPLTSAAAAGGPTTEG